METLIKPPSGFFGTLDIGEILRRHELIFSFAVRDIKVRYRRALIGIGWAILQPFSQMVLFSIIFGKFAKIPSDGFPYPIFVYSALIPWQFFSRALTEASLSVVANAGVISKIYFPRIILPLASIISSSLDFFIALSVLFLLMIFYGVYPPLNILLFPVFLTVLVMCALGVALWLSAINVKFRDVKYALQFINLLWFFSTPVIYPTSFLPENFRFIISFNPMVSIIEGFRWCILGYRLPDIGHFALSVFVVIFLFISGLWYFHRTEKEFADIA